MCIMEKTNGDIFFGMAQVYPGWRGRWLHDDGIAAVATRISSPGWGPGPTFLSPGLVQVRESRPR